MFNNIPLKKKAWRLPILRVCVGGGDIPVNKQLGQEKFLSTAPHSPVRVEYNLSKKYSGPRQHYMTRNYKTVCVVELGSLLISTSY